MYQPFVSVVVCVRNRPLQVLACLRSILKSDYRDFEVVVVDDASTDDTREQVRAFAVAHPEAAIRLVALLENRGVSGARNAGIDAARGELIFFTDSDCTVFPNWLSAAVARFAAPEVAAMCGAVIDPPPRNLAEAAFFGNTTLGGSRLQQRDLVGNNMGFRREVLQEFPFDDQLTYGCDEDDVARRLRAFGKQIVFAPDAVVRHHHPMRLKTYLAQAWRQGRGSARYWFKYGRYLGRDVLGSALAWVSLAVALWEPRALIVAALALGLQLAALWLNERLFKQAPLGRSLAVLPVALLHNLFKTLSVLCTLARIALGWEPAAWKARRAWRLKPAPRTAILVQSHD